MGTWRKRRPRNNAEPQSQKPEIRAAIAKVGISPKERSPAEPETRNPKSEIRNKFKKMEISKMARTGPGSFVAGREQVELLECKDHKEGWEVMATKKTWMSGLAIRRFYRKERRLAERVKPDQIHGLRKIRGRKDRIMAGQNHQTRRAIFGRNIFVGCFEVLAALWGVSFSSCGPQVQLEAAEPGAATASAEVYQRATAEFLEANFYKPLESGTNDLTFTLAPLIIQEVKSPESQVHGHDRFGTLCSSNGVVTLDRSRPAVYFFADSVQFNGRPHARFAYVWFYSADTSQSGDRGLPMQGVRMMLNTNGQPVVWEVLTDTSGKGLVFVSQKLEAAARAEFGPPLPGRKFAIERSREEAPNAVVARVLDDGPMPMGPIVYLEAERRKVSTIICRCMPAQAKTLVGTSTYELLPLSATDSLLIREQIRSPVQKAFWPGDEPNDGRLASRLRLPSSF